MTPNDALRTVFGWYPTERLEKLRQAFKEDRVIRKQYVDANGNRCIMAQLDECITSRYRLQQKFTDQDDYRTTRMVIESWDAGNLTKMEVQQVLADAIQKRHAAAAAQKEVVVSEEENLFETFAIEEAEELLAV